MMTWAGHNGPRGGQGLGSSWQQVLAEGHVERVRDLKSAGGLLVVVEAGE